LRAVAYGDSDDTSITHGETEARVILNLEQGRRIEWVRQLKGTPRVSYALYENDVLLHEGRPIARGQVPEWITELLGVAKVDGLDIQLGSQKEPVFLLNEGPSTRAQLLSVGRESGRLHQLIEAYGTLCRRDREQVRDGEADLIRLRYRINASSVLATLPPMLEQLAETVVDLENHNAKTVQLGRLLQRVSTIEQRRARFGPLVNALEALPSGTPQVVPTATLSRVIQVLSSTERVTRISNELPTVAVPQVRNLQRLCDMGARISRLIPRASIKPVARTAVLLPVLTDTSLIAKAGGRLAAQLNMKAELEASVTVATTEVLTAHDQLEATTVSLGGICPLCSGQLPKELGGTGLSRETRV
jgi:DNA repair exonuclease SbcCD ATPase subunit